MKSRWGIYVDVKRCVGCYACVVACKEVNRLPPFAPELPPKESVNWIQIEAHSPRGEFPDPSLLFIPKHCNHCENPACADACPARAIYKRNDGIVLISPEMCTGCQDCVAACPYGQMHYNPDTGVAEKCTLCVHLVERGEDPACVSTCVGSAMYFGDLNDSSSNIVKQIRNSGAREDDLWPALKGERPPGPCVIYKY